MPLDIINQLGPQWSGVIAQTSAVIVALVLGFLGLLDVKSWIFHPKLKISIRMEPPDCHFVPFTERETHKVVDKPYYIRFRATNEGNREARNVQVMASKLHKFNGKEYEEVKSFLPLNLVWSNRHDLPMKEKMIMESIPVEVDRHCDLGFLTTGENKNRILNFFPSLSINSENTDVILKMDTVIESNIGSHIIFPGKYKLTVYVSASNAITIKKDFEIDLKNKWNSDSGEKMIFVKETDIEKEEGIYSL